MERYFVEGNSIYKRMSEEELVRHALTDRLKRMKLPELVQLYDYVIRNEKRQKPKRTRHNQRRFRREAKTQTIKEAFPEKDIPETCYCFDGEECDNCAQRRFRNLKTQTIKEVPLPEKLEECECFDGKICDVCTKLS